MGGSSPPTRGARYLSARGSLSARIIPAYAGSTRENKAALDDIADHPRLRGEHVATDSIAARFSGSSPPTRGALELVGLELAGSRIIPAYAGSTIA